MSNAKLTIYFEGAELQASEGQTVAEALLGNGITEFGANHKGLPRGPFCLMGLCGQCLVKIDKQINERACARKVEPQMSIYRQHDGNISRENEAG